MKNENKNKLKRQSSAKSVERDKKNYFRPCYTSDNNEFENQLAKLKQRHVGSNMSRPWVNKDKKIIFVDNKYLESNKAEVITLTAPILNIFGDSKKKPIEDSIKIDSTIDNLLVNEADEVLNHQNFSEKVNNNCDSNRFSVLSDDDSMTEVQPNIVLLPSVLKLDSINIKI